MSAKDIVRNLLAVVGRFLDTDHDGRVEISDLPGALAKAAAMQASGLALVQAGASVVESFTAAASAGVLTSGGVTLTAEDVKLAYARAKVPFTTAANEARAELGR